MIMGSSVCLYIASMILLWYEVPLIQSAVNLAFNKHTIQSTYYDGFPPSNAVDGQKNCVFGFAHTQAGPSEWWQVDLGEVCEIKTIKIFYRTGFKNRLDGYAINITKSLNPLETWQCYKDTDSGEPTSLTPSHECRRLGQYVKFSRDIPGGYAVISLCELEVYGCPHGFYGYDNCKSQCSVDCIHSRCDPDNGNCEKISIRTTTEGQGFQINSYIGSIIAGVVSLINIVLIVVILVLYCKRRRRKETVYENQKPLDWTQEGMNQQDNNQLEQQQTVHYETLGLHDRGSVNNNAAQAYTGLNVNTQGRY